MKKNITQIIVVNYHWKEEVKIPAGFVISPIKEEQHIDTGLVIIDSEGNEFVWIPITSENYVRIDFGTQAGLYTTYHEDLPTDELASIQKYNGFYIGRYEAGDYESTQNKTLRNENSDTTNKITIKKQQAPYNYITQEKALLLSKQMAQVQGYSSEIKTKLCSSYAWDSAIMFIKDTINDYDINSIQGNYQDTTFNFFDINGNKKEKLNSDKYVVPTSQTTAVCNIFDMGGNIWEYTTEKFSLSQQPVSRGGAYGGNFSVNPAGRRNTSEDVSKAYYGFRVSLYL